MNKLRIGKHPEIADYVEYLIGPQTLVTRNNNVLLRYRSPTFCRSADRCGPIKYST